VNFFTKAIAIFVLALPCLAFGNQVAILRNGFSISHQRHEVIGTVTRLYTAADGSYVDVPTDQIDHFEEETAPAQVSASAVVTPASSTPVATTRQQRTISPLQLNDVVNDASGRHNLDPDLINSVIRAESGFNVHAVSNKGAQGLMQLMPQTASTLGVGNAFDPRANVEGGTRYLRELLEKYNFDLVKALAAYNAGPLRVQQYGGVPPYYETRAYVARIIRDYNRKKLAEQQTAKKTKKTPARASSHPVIADSKQQSSIHKRTIQATQ
jgi:soluble lytic murein transglycosylase-like protein